MIETDFVPTMTLESAPLESRGRINRTVVTHSPLYNAKPTSVKDIIRAKGSFWTADELADVLSISRKHIYKLSKGGRIPCYRMGGAIRFDPEATARWLEQRAIN